MKQKKNIKKWLALSISAVVLMTGICVGIVFAAGGSANTSLPVTITYKSGTYGDGASAASTKLFGSDVADDTKNYSYTIYPTDTLTPSGKLILPGEEFKDNISDSQLNLQTTAGAAGIYRLSYTKDATTYTDDESFYFGHAENDSDFSDEWAYTFTGWMIEGETKKIPGKTVFQPGDDIRPEILKKFEVKDAGGNVIGYELNLVAVWGKCYFIRNPYENMKYKAVQTNPNDATKTVVYFDPDSSTNPTGAWDTKLENGTTIYNDGKDPLNPMATIDGLYESIRKELGAKTDSRVHDCYRNVVMLVGKLEYIKDTDGPDNSTYYGYKELDNKNNGVFISATYKSFSDTSNKDDAPYEYYHKPHGYASTLYGNIRFDNIKFLLAKMPIKTAQTCSTEFLVSHFTEDTTKTTDDPYTVDSYVEITARYNVGIKTGVAINTLRPNDATYVVVNGGYFSQMQNQYSSGVETGKQLYWTIGRKATVVTLNCGTTSTYVAAAHKIYYKYDVYILGGTITHFYGGSQGMNTICAGKRNLYLLGDGKGGAHDPNVTNFYGGASQARLYGDVTIVAKNCTKLKNIYGGGRDFTSTTFGNIELNIENCIIAGDLHGGGEYANCEAIGSTYIEYIKNTDGNPNKIMNATTEDIGELLDGSFTSGHGGKVTINLDNTTVKGTIFGSGMGQAQAVLSKSQGGLDKSKADQKWNENGTPEYDENGNLTGYTLGTLYPDGWDDAIDDYPIYDSDNRRVLIKTGKSMQYTTSSPELLSYYLEYTYASLSVAMVDDVEINIKNSTVETVYGGGSIAKVCNSVNIEIVSSKVNGDVFGGGDGVDQPAAVTVYKPNENAEYTPPSYKFKSENNQYKVEFTEEIFSTTEYKCEWSDDETLLDTDGVDFEHNLIYSPDADGYYGVVMGDVKVVITDSTVSKNVYGGGNLGAVYGTTSVVINEGTVVNSADENYGKVFGGGNGSLDPNRQDPTHLGAVKATLATPSTPAVTTLTVNGGTVKEAYGGCNAADVDGDSNLIINGGTVVNGYGGNNKMGDIYGKVNATLAGGRVSSRLFGGGNEAAYTGITNMLISGGVVGQVDNNGELLLADEYKAIAYGGGRLATVKGTNVNITGGKIRSLFGGSYQANISGYDTYLDADSNRPLADGITSSLPAHVAVTVEILGGEIYTFLGGNDASGNINGDIIINVGDYENPYTPTSVPTTKLSPYIKNFFGGGNKANYTYKAGWNPGLHIRDELTQDVEFGGIRVFLHSGQIYQAFGGGVEADITNTVISVRGGFYNFIYGGGYRGDALNSAIHMRAGLVSGEWLEYDQDDQPRDDQGGYVFAGGYDGYVKNPNIHMVGGTIHHSLFGGGNLAGVGYSAVVIKGGTVRGSVYGGGYRGNAGYKKDNVTPVNKDDPTKDAGTYVEITGGDIGQYVEGTVTSYVGNVYGGGYRGDCLETHVDIIEHRFDANIDITLGGNIYGGGHEAKVNGDTHVHFINGHIDGNVYGGGRDGDVEGTCYVDIFDGTFGVVDKDSGEVTGGNIYGGGLNGKATATKVLVTDDKTNTDFVTGYSDILNNLIGEKALRVEINGNVFGGGEGTEATVKNSTKVVINLDCDFVAVEEEITTTENTNSDITSGKIKTQLLDASDTSKQWTETGSKYSFIKGNVYGGGDLGGVGEGTIDSSSNTAVITKPGNTSVTLTNGYIEGSVFGGGNGVPKTEAYKSHMGVVFGSTNVVINGGYIKTNVYGGGTQSRVYSPSDAPLASSVTIEEKTGAKIAIGGSVFGGGHRGNSAAINADIPTTIGNVVVKIIAREQSTTTSNIYFLGHNSEGGVYGDGNLCLVNGQKTILLKDFNTGTGNHSLKTFYSLQRADKVTIDNSAVVLLGALDLVDDNGDAAKYSINRVKELYMTNGSTFKLEDIVKYLGRLESDVDTARQFIYEGNNGKNNYTNASPIGMLSEDEIVAYRDDDDTDYYYGYRYKYNENGALVKVTDAKAAITEELKNVVCVANGKYLEIKNENNTYGGVYGLFTLQLLYDIPGEGGGYVYGDIIKSTGDFICETTRGWQYKAVTSGTGEDNAFTAADFIKGTHYCREPGVGYVLADAYEAGVVYYTREENSTFMLVEDNVGGHKGNVYTYYYWYISGPVIKYTDTVIGYIGSSEESFELNKTVPEHTETLKYVLYDINGNASLENALKKYTLKWEYDDIYDALGDIKLVDQQIALELILGGESLGFLKYTAPTDPDVPNAKGTWSIYHNDAQEYLGSEGDVNKINANTLATTAVSKETSSMVIVLHKSKGVNAEITDMNVSLDIDLYLGNEMYANGVSTLIFDIGVAIVRLVPEQDMFITRAKSYAGVGSVDTVNITGQSAYSVEYQTLYIPNVYHKDYGSMEWYLSAAEYTYLVDNNGHMLTLGANGVVVNISDNIDWSGEWDGTGVPPTAGHMYYDKTENVYKCVCAKDGVTEARTLTKNQELSTVGSHFPKNTKITMIDLSGSQAKYYYYLVTTPVTEIDLMDFYVMGTQTTVGSLTNDDVPDFKKIYENDATALSRVKERIVFIVDFLDVNWSNESEDTKTLFSSDVNVTLRHFYRLTTSTEPTTYRKDIMDYVKTEVSSDNNTPQGHIRVAPSKATYRVDSAETGIDLFKVELQSKTVHYQKDTTDIKLTLDADTEWQNTLFKEGEFSMKLELVKPIMQTVDGVQTVTGYEEVQFPIGIVFKLAAGTTETEFYTGQGRWYAVIPLGAFSEHTECSVTIENLVYDLYNAPAVGNAYYRVTIYSSPDSNYYDAYDTVAPTILSYIISPNPKYSVSVKVSNSTDDQIFAVGDTVALDVTYNCSNSSIKENELPEFTVEKKLDGNYNEYTGFNITTGNKTTNASTGNVSLGLSLNIDQNANDASGSYRLKCVYGNRTEYLYFIVRSE